MIVWQDLIGPVLLAALAIFLVASVGLHARRKTRQLAAAEARKQDRAETFRELRNFLLNKATHDLAQADNGNVAYIKAFIELIQQAGTVDDLRPIAEVYRYRSGFKSEWIGE